MCWWNMPQCTWCVCVSFKSLKCIVAFNTEQQTFTAHVLSHRLSMKTWRLCSVPKTLNVCCFNCCKDNAECFPYWCRKCFGLGVKSLKEEMRVFQPHNSSAQHWRCFLKCRTLRPQHIWGDEDLIEWCSTWNEHLSQSLREFQKSVHETEPPSIAHTQAHVYYIRYTCICLKWHLYLHTCTDLLTLAFKMKNTLPHTQARTHTLWLCVQLCLCQAAGHRASTVRWREWQEH